MKKLFFIPSFEDKGSFLYCHFCL